MKKRFILALLLGAALILTNCAVYAASVSITGDVSQPLNLSLKDLNRFKTVRVELNEVLKDGSYRGAWFYTGVPLRSLLETACIRKEGTAFSKAIDLAVLVKNSEGREVALSWGEIFLKPETNVVIATSAEPIKPRHSCSSCHKSPDVPNRYMKEFDRKIGFPKLVVTGDGYADRSIENIVSIKVIDPAARMPVNRSARLFSPSFVVTGDVRKELTFNDLSGFPRKKIRVIIFGEGRGYHGIDDYSGVLFNDIINKAGVDPSLSKVFLISAPDGYRSLFSYGEIFLNRDKDNTIIADRKNGKTIGKGGRFIFVPSGDLMADRDIKSVDKIEVMDLKTKPKLSIIGVGCGDADLLTMQAVTAMAGADEYICPPDIKKRFGKYMGDKPVLMNLYDFVPPVMKKKYPELSPEELRKKVEEKRIEIVDKIKAELKKGKSVAILVYGDPTIWSASEYIVEHFGSDMINIIPGLSSFNVASALIKSHTGCNGSIILADSRGILENKPMFEAAAKEGETLCVFMAMKNLPGLIDFFKGAYKQGAPVDVVYRAGYSASEKVVKTDLNDLKKTIDSEREKHLFLVFIGPCLESKMAQRH